MATPTGTSLPARVYYRGDKEVEEEIQLTRLHFTIDEKSGVATIFWNEPKKLNRLTVSLIMELQIVLEQCKRDDRVKALLWTGAGTAFSCGADFGDPTMVVDQEIVDGYNKAGKGAMPIVEGASDIALKGLVTQMMDLEKPSICACNGLAVGGSANFVLLLHDFVLCAPEAKFKYPFTSLGLTPEVGSSFILPAMIGMPAAKKMLMLGDWISAQEVKDVGLALDVVPQAELLPKARALAERLAASSATIGMQKRVIHANFWHRAFHLADAMQAEGETIIESMAQPAFREALKGFAKRAAKSKM